MNDDHFFVEEENLRSQKPCNRIGQVARGSSIPDGRRSMSTSSTTAKTRLRKEPLELRVAEIGGHNTNLKILALDEPMTEEDGSPNNACHLYAIEIGDVPAVTIPFQRGPVKENGVNGISNEALLMIVAHRFEGFQSGQFAGTDNAEALEHVYNALRCMARRTQGRVLAQVEGYDKPDPGKG